MAVSGGLGFEPVLHNITSDKVVFCYRANDDDSLDVARYYQSARNLPDSHLIALPCSDNTFINEQEYLETIESPLLSALTLLNGTSSSGDKEIWVIVLGYNIPLAFYADVDEYDPYDSENLIAVASRLHRLGFDRSNLFPNYTYDRRGDFRFFDSIDAQNLYITAVLDGPNTIVVKQLIDRAKVIDRLSFVTGKVFVDPYGKQTTNIQLQYQADILDFIENELPNLGLDSETTVATRDGRDPVINFFSRDSFYWGWFTPRYSKELFLNQNEKRIFLYNADDDAAQSLKEPLSQNSSDPWCNIAIGIQPGYAATAGAVSIPGEDAYLRPRPFFETLHRGASLGEAFLYSSPYVDWRIILIGDPLMTVKFPVDIPDDQNPNNTLLPNFQSIFLAKESIEEAVAWGIRQANILEIARNTNVSSVNIDEEIALLSPIAAWHAVKNGDSQADLIHRAAFSLISYISQTTGMSFSEWLQEHNYKTTELFNNMLRTSVPNGIVSSDLLHPKGHWEYEFQYIHQRQTLENVHFRLQIATDAKFNNIQLDLSSYNEIDNWKYEAEPYRFVQLTNSGFPSNFSGRKIRFEASSEYYLERTEIYFRRWSTLNEDGITINDWQIDPNMMIVKR